MMIDTHLRTIKRIKEPQYFTLEKKKVAAYCRVSVDFEINLHSLNAQVDYYRTYIQSRPDWSFAGIYADEGLSGTTSNRTGFENLLKDCELGKIDIILTKSISRFARNTVLLLKTIRVLKEKGINVHFERENIDSLSNSGELLLTLLASFAEEESRSISENTKWAIRKNFEKGIGNHFSPMLGYRFIGEEFIVVPSEAETVKLIFSLYLDGLSPDSITTYLNQHGIKTVNGNAFKYGCVWGILRQIKYTGNSIFQKTFTESYLTHKTKRNHGELKRYFAEGTHPVIISQETFDAVQTEIEVRKSLGYLANTSKQFSVFTGKIICSKCGHTYRRSNSGTSGRHKSIYYYWKCGTKFSKGKTGCPSSLIPEKKLYSLAFEVTDKLDDIKQILVKDTNLIFTLTDGTTITKEFKRATS